MILLLGSLHNGAGYVCSGNSWNCFSDCNGIHLALGRTVRYGDDLFFPRQIWHLMFAKPTNSMRSVSVNFCRASAVKINVPYVPWFGEIFTPMFFGLAVISSSFIVFNLIDSAVPCSLSINDIFRAKKLCTSG